MIDSSTSSSAEKLDELSARPTLRMGGLVVDLGDGTAMLEGTCSIRDLLMICERGNEILLCLSRGRIQATQYVQCRLCPTFVYMGKHRTLDAYM